MLSMPSSSVLEGGGEHDGERAMIELILVLHVPVPGAAAQQLNNDSPILVLHLHDPYRDEAQCVSDIRPVGERLGMLLEHSESGRGQYLIGTRQHSLDHRPREHHAPLLIRGDLDLGAAAGVLSLLAVDERSPHRQLQIDRPRPALRRQVIVRRGLLVPEQVGGQCLSIHKIKDFWSENRNPVDGGVERLERGHVSPTFRS